MSIHERLRDAMLPRAEGVILETLSIGLGYTCARMGDGGVGVAYTCLEGGASGCSMLGPDEEYEGRPAAEALKLLAPAKAQGGLDGDAGGGKGRSGGDGMGRNVRRAIGLATVNALNHARGLDLPEDRDNGLLFDALHICPGARVAMVGCFTPLLGPIRSRGAELELVDRGKGMGDEEAFRRRLGDWATAVILTSTSIVNDTIDGLLEEIGPGARVALLGPSTPMVPEAFAGLGVHVLAGTVPLDGEATLRAVRQAKGTPLIQRFSRKPTLVL
jgi:hypothetical protein